MANNQPFVLKNAVEVGKNIDVTLGSISSSTVDLSTGNYFAETLTANTTYTFSNPGDVQSFQMEITGGAVGFNLSNAALDSGQELSFSAYETSPSMGAVSGDGEYVYVAGTAAAGCTVYQFQLSTPYDLTTGAFYSSKAVTSQASNPDALGFSSDGTKMWVGQSGTVYQYTLSTAWNVSTASYDSKTLSSGSVITGVSASNDGTKFYVVEDGGNRIREHTLSTANDISTAGGATLFSVSGQTSSPSSGEISSNGLKFYVAGGGAIYEYDLSTANDISTASYNSVSFSTGYSVVDGMGITANGLYIFIAESNNDKFRRISMSGATSITWPSSVDWPYGQASDSSGSGKKDIFSFVTPDSGTTYYGFKSAADIS